MSSSQQRRLCTVEVIRARNIAGFNKKSGTSDAFCVVSLLGLNGRCIDSEKYKTSVRSRSLAPEWDQTFSMGRLFSEQMIFFFECSCLLYTGTSYDLNRNRDLPTLEVCMYHKGGILSTDEPLGKMTVPLDTIDPSGASASSSWFPLEKDGRMKIVSGEV